MTSTLFSGVRNSGGVYETGGLPPLECSDQFQLWSVEQNRSGGVSKAIETLLERGDELATFRAACLGQWFAKPNIYRELMHQSFSASEIAISAQAQSFLLLLDFVQDRTSVSFCIPLLEDLAYRLEATKQNSLVGEARVAVLTNLGLIKSSLRLHSESRTLAAQAVFLARHFKLPISEMRANNLLIQTNLLSGQVTDGLKLIQQSLANGVEDQHAATYQQLAVAACLAHLGDAQKAVQWLDNASLDPTNPHAIRSVRQWYACLSGLDDPDTPLEERYQPTTNVIWLVNSLRHCLAAEAIPRTNKYLEERKRRLDQAIACTRAAQNFASDWYFLLNRWISTTALLWQGKAALSAHSLTGLRAPAREWLELRSLLAGLRLEQALDLNLPSLAIEHAEEELLEVFRDSESIPMASPEGLADLLMFWHPLAAAYMAVAFPNLPHLSPALENILRLGGKNSALGRTVSPALAGELLLRSLNLDLIESQPLTQVKLGAGERGNFREEILTFTRGPRTYYRPPVSALRIAYGLRKHGAGTLMADVAWSVLNQYGLCPRASGSEMQLRMGTLEALTHDLLDDRITVQEFSRGCYALV